MEGSMSARSAERRVQRWRLLGSLAQSGEQVHYRCSLLANEGEAFDEEVCTALSAWKGAGQWLEFFVGVSLQEGIGGLPIT